jgi:5-methylcytosine-specific restriction endonuclease McrA
MAKRISHAKMKHRVMTPEDCAHRMTKFLSTAPKSAKTRAYLATLPKRMAPIKVLPDEFKIDRKKQFERGRGIAAAIIERLQIEANRAPDIVRKDRIRPKWRSLRGIGRWACRDGDFRHIDGAGKERHPRNMLECQTQRDILYEAQGGLCGLCGEVMKAGLKHSLDHVIPRFLGGPDALGNLLLAHGECNGRKSNDAPTGCECVWLLAVNARLGVQPKFWKAP